MMEEIKLSHNKIVLAPKLRFSEFKDNWKPIKLSSVGEFKNGINKGKEDFGIGIPFVNLMDVFGKDTISDLDLGLVNANESEIINYCLKKGDVLFIRSSVKKSGVGETSVVMKDLPNTVYSGFLIRYRTQPGNIIDIFKKYCFWTKAFRNELISHSTTSANTNINQESLNKLSLNLPSLPEQEKIAAFLTAVDEKIQQLTRKKQLLEQYKKGVMQQLFSGKLRFKDENGKAFPKWEEKKLGEICDIKGRIGYRGYTTEDIVQKGNGAITTSPSNINNGNLDFQNSVYISWFKYDESPEIKLNVDDILLVKTGSTYGKSAIVKKLNEPATINPQLVILKKIVPNAQFLSYIIQSPLVQMQIGAVISFGAVPNMSQENISKFIIPIPCKEEQKKIADFLSSIDAKIKSVTETLDATNRFKKGLLQQMFV